MSMLVPRGAPRPRPLHPTPPPVKAPIAGDASSSPGASPAVTLADDRLSRACRRVLGWLAPRRAAGRYLPLFGTHLASAERHGCLPGCAARRSWLRLRDRTLKLGLWGDPDRQPFVLLAASAHATDAALFAPWVEALTAAGYAVVSFERARWPAARQAPATLPELAKDLVAIGERFGPADAVVGHSIGASAAVLAMSEGLEAGRLVLMSAQADPRDAVERFARRIGVGEPAGRYMAAMLEDRMGVALDDLQAHRIAPAIATPALVVHDLLDDEVPWAEGERFARHLPASRLLTTLDLGHRGVLGDARVLRDCMRFLAGDAVGERVVSSPNLPYGLA